MRHFVRILSRVSIIAIPISPQCYCQTHWIKLCSTTSSEKKVKITIYNTNFQLADY